MADKRTLSNNTLAFMALSNEFCHALENAAQTPPQDFTRTMLRLLPRIYISATDLSADTRPWAEGLIVPALDENHYLQVREAVARCLGEDDTYLDVEVEDMKYSDTPVAAHISEQLADIFQVLYNFIETVRDATDTVVAEAVQSAYDDFNAYWSRNLCNALRMLNAINTADSPDW